MSTLCIDDTNKVGIGFTQMPIVRSEIEDAQKASGVSLNKMGTSIPTPFARLFLFISAFSEINSRQQNDPFIAHNGDTAYHALISEWLDMMEFLFVYGHDTDSLQIIPWTIADDLNNLKGSIDKHNKLAAALEDGLKNTPKLQGVSKIYIFRYDGIILGGSSPLSLVYSSPNWRRENNNVFYRSGNGNGNLFDDIIVPLHQRGIEFRRFLHKYIDKYGTSISNDISTYVTGERNQYDGEINKEYNATLLGSSYSSDFDELYQPLKDISGASVSVGNMPIFCKIDKVTSSNSDYEILATSNRYNIENINGASVNIGLVPLVLSKNGMDGATYWKGQKWNPSFEIDASLPSTLSTRKLPGFHGTTYPFVTIDDFLEEKIIEVSYNLNRKKFYTGSRGNVQFLLPLKKEIFKFFEPNDLFQVDVNGNVTPTDMFSIEEINPDSDDRKIVARLSIPTKGGKMEFVREYKNESIVDCFDFKNPFNLAFFPFYRMINGGKNIYNVMLGYKGGVKNVDFFNFDDLAHPIKKDENERSRGAVKTSHIHLEDTFDVVELNAQDAKGLIVPIMCVKDIDASQYQYVFCVDFGTTNTHIAYGRQGSSGRISYDKVHSFEITEQDLQTVYLNDHEEGNAYAGFGQFSDFLTSSLREFVPSLIGDEKVKLPMPTTVCEVPNFQTVGPNLFGNINVGFNYLNEIGNNQEGVYRTNIKWNPNESDTRAKDRVKMFFKELMWIMKNKAVMNDGRPDFKLVFTYPQSMRNAQVSNLQKFWDEARKDVGATMNDNVASLNTKALEGVAPYFSFLPELQFGETYANVDIGGGTTDIIYINPVQGGEKISYSAVFAANDLWGDGPNPHHGSMQNGFLLGYLNSSRYANLRDDDSIKNKLMSFKDAAEHSSDVISYLFSKDKSYEFTDYLENSDLRVLMLVHFSSIVYYMSLAFLRDNVELPHHITFTGMGSKYIQLLGDANCLNEVITKIFEYRLKSENIAVSKIDVRFAPDPKRVTASGGVVMSSGSAIDPECNLVYGWNQEEFSNKRIAIDEISAHKADLLTEFNRFLDMFENPDFSEVVYNNTNVQTRGLKAKIEQFAENSFKQMQILQSENSTGGAGVKVEEPMFFWPLKNALFELGRQMASSSK